MKKLALLVFSALCMMPSLVNASTVTISGIYSTYYADTKFTLQSVAFNIDNKITKTSSLTTSTFTTSLTAAEIAAAYGLNPSKQRISYASLTCYYKNPSAVVKNSKTETFYYKASDSGEGYLITSGSTNLSNSTVVFVAKEDTNIGIMRGYVQDRTK